MKDQIEEPVGKMGFLVFLTQDIFLDILFWMNRKQRKILAAIFKKPTASNIVWANVEKLVISLGGQISEGSGSRVGLKLNEKSLYVHRPHPAKEAKKYVIDLAREFLTSAGVKP